MIQVTKYIKKFSRKNLITYYQDFVALFFPFICNACGRSRLKNELCICTDCLYHLPKTNYHLDSQNPVSKIFWGRVTITAAASYYLFSKRGKVQHLIHQLKYKGKEETGYVIGKLYGTELQNNPLFSTIDCIVPVPLHPVKLRKRGYNQSESFARGLSQSLQCSVNTDILFRSTASETQTKKSRFSRWKNVECLFYTHPKANFHHQHILLVDDVVTTGATLEACSRELLKIPGVKVSIATIAYASIT